MSDDDIDHDENDDKNDDQDDDHNHVSIVTVIIASLLGAL